MGSYGISNVVEKGHSSNSSELVQKKAIDGTPFDMVRIMHDETDKVRHFVAMGRYRITPDFETQEEALKHLETESWNIVLKMLAILIPGEIKTQTGLHYKTIGEELERIQMEREGKVSITTDDLIEAIKKEQ